MNRSLFAPYLCFLFAILFSIPGGFAQKIEYKTYYQSIKNNNRLKYSTLSQISDTAYPLMVRKSMRVQPGYPNAFFRLFNKTIAEQANSSVSLQKVTSTTSGISLNISYTETTCGYSNGTITVVATGGTAPYNFSENGYPAQSNGNFIQLAAGTYAITVTDALAQTATATVVLTNTYNPPTANVLTYTNASGCSATDASVTLGGSGGTPPYTYSIDMYNFQTSNTFTNLAAGRYSFFVKDANGCVAPIYFPLSENCSFTFAHMVSLYACNNNGTADILSVSGGVAPYTFSIDGTHFQSSGSFTNIPSGILKIYIRDATGLTLVYAFDIFKSCVVDVTAAVTDAICNNNDGQISLQASAGTPPYLYSIDGINFQTANLFTGLSPGTYTITVSDAAGNLTPMTVWVGDKCFSLTIGSRAPTCGYNNGDILFLPSGGTKPYIFSIDGGNNFYTTDTFRNLGPGNYGIVVRDANGQEQVATILFDASSPVKLSIQPLNTSCANHDGEIDVSAFNGIAPYKYSINNAALQSNGNFKNLDTGTYLISAQSTDGCLGSQNVSISVTNNLWVDAGIDTTDCEGASITLHGNSNAMNYSWTPANLLKNSDKLNPIATPTSSTVFILTAKTGVCTSKDSVKISILAAPVPLASGDTIICKGQSASLFASGGVSYSWSPGIYLSNPSVPNPVVSKPEQTEKYHLTVTDAVGCKSLKDVTVSIAVTPPPVVFIGKDTAIAFHQILQLNAQDINNSGFNQFSWSPSTTLSDPYISNPIASPTDNTIYTVNATTAGGCEGTASIQVKLYDGPDIYVPNAFTPNGDGRNDVFKTVPIGIIKFNFLAVYNRWGVRVFYSNDPGKGWDGYFHGVPQDPTAFTWMASGIDYNGNTIQRKGTVVLIR